MSRWGDPVIRFMTNVVPDADGCHIWTGLVAKNGYGKIHWKGRKQLAHRVAFEIATGKDVPVDVLIRHTCDVRACVNPNHLIPGTHAQNTEDMMTRGRHVAWNKGTADKTCPQHGTVKTVYPNRRAVHVEAEQYYCPDCRRERR